MCREKKINPNNVSHIEIYDTHKGRESYWNDYVDYIWMEADYFKFLWLFKISSIGYKAGYYKNCKREWLSNDEPVGLRKQEYTLLGEIHTYPKMIVYSGGYKITEEYYESVEEIYKICDEKFPNVNVILK